MKTDKEDFLDNLFKKAVEDTNKQFPNDPPMEWPENVKNPKKPDLIKVSDQRSLQKDQNETESEETYLSDFGKLYQSLSKEEREEALREVGQMQKEGLIKVSDK